MSHRQTVDFLRRRYAAAILCDDAATAGRLRVQLDDLMNWTDARRLDEVLQPEAAQPLGLPVRSPAAERPAGGSEPRLRLVTPVTGLLDGPRGGRQGPG